MICDKISGRRQDMYIHMKEIKNYIVTTTKESIKFAMLAMIIFFLIGVPMVYISVNILKMDENISGIIVGIITAIIIVIVDHKKKHSLSKTITKLNC